MAKVLEWANQFAGLPDTLRWSLVLCAGLFLGSQLNRGIYRLAWSPRAIGPWSPADPAAPRRSWWDFLPVAGWFGLDRESFLHGRGYWLRPLLIEFGFALGLLWLYVWELDGGLVVPVPGIEGVIHLQFLSHMILLSWMVIATFIDFDEKLIPDGITIPGTLVGIALATLVPQSLLPDQDGVLVCASPFEWPAWLDQFPGLALAWGVWWLWCLALIPKTIYFRRGLARGLAFLAASMVRTRLARWLLLLGATGSLAIFGIYLVGFPHWAGLLTALAGMTFGLLLTWSVRTIAGVSMGREALGFGDVTLMAMIGAYMGWQPILMIFGVAPFAAVFIALAQWFVTRSQEIAYGPFLCAATLIVLLAWPALWAYFGTVYFVLGGWLIVFLIGCLLMMGLMLGGIRLVKSLR